MNNHLISITLLTTLLSIAHAKIERDSIKMIKEETINNSSFKHILTIKNGQRNETLMVNQHPVSVDDYEEALLEAEKEESKITRRALQAERLRVYETQYKGQAKIAQKELKDSLELLKQELERLSDTHIQPFISFSKELISSPEELDALHETIIPQAEKLIQEYPTTTNIKELQEKQQQLQELRTKIHDLFISAVNKGIDTADDTKLLKELLALL